MKSKMSIINALIVDDSPDNREEIVAYLKSMGHGYLEAADVATARKHLAEREFDYVVLDLCLPMEPGNAYADKSFGKNMLQHILQEKAGELPVLVVSGVAKDAADIVEIMKLRSAGALVSYVLKPFRSEGNPDIVREIHGLLMERDERRAKRATDRKKPQPPRKKKPEADGSDQIDLTCSAAGARSWRILVNGEQVVIGQRMLNILIRFGQAQRDWPGKKKERHLASLSIEEFGLPDNTMPSDLSSLLTKMKKRLASHACCNLIKGKHGRWFLGATIKNLEAGELHYEA